MRNLMINGVRVKFETVISYRLSNGIEMADNGYKLFVIVFNLSNNEQLRVMFYNEKNVNEYLSTLDSLFKPEIVLNDEKRSPE